MRDLSELEGICLGIVAKGDACSAYRVRRELRDSPSSHWRASAGSVYPLLARLEKEGLITSTIDGRDRRGTKSLRATRRGMAALRRWIRAGASDDLVASISDPIRSRVFFLERLAPTVRAAFLDTVIARMERYLQETMTHLEADRQDGDRYEYLGCLGATMVTRSRLEWLRCVRRELGD